jgi:hypothetical protein
MTSKLKNVLDNISNFLTQAGADEKFIDKVKTTLSNLDGSKRIRKRLGFRVNKLIAAFDSNVMQDVTNQDDMSLLIGGEMEDILDGMAEMTNQQAMGQGSYIFYQQAWEVLKTNLKKLGDFNEFKRQFKIMLHGIKRLITNEDSL